MVRVYADIQRRHAAGERQEAKDIFHGLLPILAFSNQELATSIAFFKRLLVRKGVFSTDHMRMPGFVWDKYNARIADELIEHYLALESRVSSPRTA
jgi:4-hydroxy-tetrahydrodipicolinate synthase